MSLERIWAIVIQELFITRRSLEVIIDLFFFSAISLLVFGLIAQFLGDISLYEAASYLFIGAIFWEVIRTIQYSTSIGALWNIWSRNLSNMFVSPLTLKEYFVAQMISGVIKSLIIFALLSILAAFFFDFNILRIGILNLTLHFFNLTLFAWALGIIILGLIFRFGTRIQALSWGLVFIFQPLSAAFFPLEILPPVLQKIALLFPATYVFEAARANLIDPSTNWISVGTALAQGIGYFLFSLWFFNVMFKSSKKSGQFARMEG